MHTVGMELARAGALKKIENLMRANKSIGEPSSCSQHKGLNVFVIHAYWNNRGDEAAIRAMIDSLRSRLLISNIKIMILSKNLGYFPYKDVSIIVLDSSLRGRPLKILSFGIDVLLTLVTRGEIAFTEQGRRYISAVNDADVVIHAPGGWVGDWHGKPELSDIPYFYRLLVPILKGKPVFFYAVSVGPFRGVLMNSIRKLIFRRVNAIIVRERISSKFLKEQLGTNSYITVDSALQNEVSKDYLTTYPCINRVLAVVHKQKVIGISFRDLERQSEYGSNSSLGEKTAASFLELIKYLLGRGYLILLIPMSFGDSEDEFVLFEHIRRSEEGKIFILPSNVDSYAQQAIISKLFCVISVRYHPCVFAAKGNVPFIAIRYEHKIEGFMEKLGRLDLMIRVEEMNPSKIIGKFKCIEKNYDTIKKQLQNKNSQLKAVSQETTEIVIKNLRNLGLVG